jgi:hypothetical protein
MHGPDLHCEDVDFPQDPRVLQEESLLEDSLQGDLRQEEEDSPDPLRVTDRHQDAEFQDHHQDEGCRDPLIDVNFPDPRPVVEILGPLHREENFQIHHQESHLPLGLGLLLIILKEVLVPLLLILEPQGADLNKNTIRAIRAI